MDATQNNNAPTDLVISQGALNSLFQASTYTQTNTRVNPLALLHAVGERVNIRSIGKPVANEIGTNFDVLFAASLEHNGFGHNCYHTINPVQPDANCLAAGDDDIAEVLWLPYDIDPNRPKGVAATDSEKEIARDVARTVLTFWQGQGVSPTVIDSGNGFYVLVPVKLSIAESVLVPGLLAAHAKQFNVAGAHVDTSIGNPSRILRIPGTVNRKGENTADRPHRLCEFVMIGNRDVELSAEDLIRIVPEAQRANQSLPKQEPTERGKGVEVDPDFDFNAFLEHYDIVVEDVRGNYYITTVCPIAGRKHEQSTTTGFYYDGRRLGFSCFASGCAGRGLKIGDVIRELNKTEGLELPNPYPGVIWPAKKEYAATDQGYAERFADTHADKFRYVADEKIWRQWDGRRWAADTTSEVNRAVKKMASKMLIDASKLQNDARLPAIKAALAIQSQKTHSNIVAMAKTEEKLVCVKERFDRHDLLLNVANGIVDLQMLTLRPHDHERMLTKMCPINFDPAATCPRWLQFLEETFPGQPEIVAFLQRSLGYTLTGDTSEQCFWLLIGGGRNGKTTLLKTMQWLLGDYAEATSFDTFAVTQKFGSAINPRDGIATLATARFVPASESDSERRISEAKLKALTGGETIKTARLYQEEFAIDPKFKIWLSTNHEPTIRGTDDGIWRRIHRVNFDHQVSAHKTDGKLLAKLEAEGAGILNWLLEGLRQYHQRGLAVPDSVRRSTAAYRDGQNPIGQFLAECCERDEMACTEAQELYSVFCGWAATNKESSISVRAFGLEVGRVFSRSRQTTGGRQFRTFQGVRLLAPFGIRAFADTKTQEGAVN